jgi:methylenetetrahydrofolate reductase (NADPH)
MKEKVPGLSVPDDVVRRMESVSPPQQSEEGIRIAVELVDAVRAIRGICGVHLIGIKWEEGVVRVAQAAGLLPRPVAEVVATVGGSA